MELIIVFLLIVAILGLLDWVALRWGYNSRLTHVGEIYPKHRNEL
ncbi:MAG: hypothetical protein WCS37_21555 [Chloroflexota bacterium]